MKSDCSAPSWLKFFTSAGIQKDSAETYAVTFSKNQIHLDMLPEIKKEYLVDMGITLMGHIIAILRHAKTVHTEEVTKSTLSTTKGNVASLVTVPPSKPVSKTTPVVVKEKLQMVSSIGKVSSSVTVPTKPATPPQPASRPPVEPQLPLEPKDKTIATSKGPPTVKLPPPRPVEPPPKRKLPGNEATSPEEPESKKAIFKRLGQVTSASSPAEPSPPNGESVFARLGQKTVAAPVVLGAPVVTTAKNVIIKPILSAQKQVVAVNRSTLISDPKKKVMMMNKGVLTRTMRADQDAPSKILSSMSLASDHASQTLHNSRIAKNNVYTRLGKAAMDEVRPNQPQPQSIVVPKTKHVSFGAVFEKTIPPVRKQQYFTRSTDSTVFSRLGV